MDEEGVHSAMILSGLWKKRIRECNLDSQGAIYLCESASWLVPIFCMSGHGDASMNAIKRQELDRRRLSAPQKPHLAGG